jgi:hypothetical protein|tara:strand:+ start:199 stop:729 length:531 start_codon:yes stop_codon:yes gene_type:complete
MIKKSRKEYMKEYYLKNKEHYKEYNKEQYLKNIEYHKEYRFKNEEKIKEYKKAYHSRSEYKERRSIRRNNRYQTDVNYRLLSLCRSRLAKAIKGFDKSAPTMKLIGCTPDELRQHIESKFEPWMNWENQGLGGWDIEHIKACFHFNMADPEQQRACFNWSNLQPMEHIANIKKGAR